MTPFDLLTTAPFVVLGVVGLVLSGRMAPARRGLASTGFVLAMVYGLGWLLWTTLLWEVVWDLLNGTPDVMREAFLYLIDFAFVAVLSVSLLLLIIAATRPGALTPAGTPPYGYPAPQGPGWPAPPGARPPFAG